MNDIIEKHFKIYNNCNSVEWQQIYFNKKTGGFVIMHRKHAANEMGDNISIANILTSLGYKIYLLPKIDTHKNSDAQLNNENWEFKTNRKGTESAIDNEIRDAKEQANNIVLKIESKISISKLENGIYNRVQRSKSIRNIIVIFNEEIFQFNRKEIVNMTFKGKIKSPKIKKGV